MKLNGRKLSCPNIEIIVIPRTGEDDIILKAQAILDFNNFHKLCPVPKPPVMIKRGVGKIEDVEDPRFKKAIEEHNKRRTEWMIIQSLGATENLVWEKVDISKPETWRNYESELKESGFGDYEVSRIINGVMRANCLDETKVAEARARFFRTQEQEPNDSISQITEQVNTPSGEPVKDSVSALQE